MPPPSSFGSIPSTNPSGQKSPHAGFRTALTREFPLLLVPLQLVSPQPNAMITPKHPHRTQKSPRICGSAVSIPLGREEWIAPCPRPGEAAFQRLHIQRCWEHDGSFTGINPATCLFPGLISHAKPQACVNYMIYWAVFLFFHCIVKKKGLE